MSAPELKPCPFCGHPPYNDEQTAHVFGIRTGHNWAVACSNCEVSAPGDQTISGAIAAWNTRASDARLAAAEAMAEAAERFRLFLSDHPSPAVTYLVTSVGNDAWADFCAALEKWEAGK